MNEVITDKDKEYEAMEQSSAPGPDQAMSDRVNNRSLRPRSEALLNRWNLPITFRLVLTRWVRLFPESVL